MGGGEETFLYTQSLGSPIGPIFLARDPCKQMLTKTENGRGRASGRMDKIWVTVKFSRALNPGSWAGTTNDMCLRTGTEQHHHRRSGRFLPHEFFRRAWRV